MVLATNEWLNNGDNEHKASSATSAPASNDAITAGTTAAPSPTTTTVTSTSTSTPATATTTDLSNLTSEVTNHSTIASDNNSVGVTTDNANNKNARLHQIRNHIEESMINSTGNILKIMADNNTTNSTLENNDNTAASSLDRDANVNPEEMENNNLAFEAFLEASFSEMAAVAASDSNTNTLLSSVASNNQGATAARQSNNSSPSLTDSTISSSSPLTPHGLSSALHHSNGSDNSNSTDAVLLNSFDLTLNQTASNNITANNNIAANNQNGTQQPQAAAAAAATATNMKQLHTTGFGSSNSIDNATLSNSCTNSTTLEPAAETSTEFGQPKIVLICEASSHPFQTRTISLTPNVECKVGRLIAKCKASENNAIFDCKVLSRNHAVLWYSDDGKFWVKDTKSSNGTFINDIKLGIDASELHYGDIVKFGVDVLENSRKEVHGCIIACVRLYLPDGREAISVDSNSPRSQYSGESRISYDELHRLNVYMQDFSHREQILKSKISNIQDILDATRKNAAGCWQSMITEDQLLHRIQTLEKKLQMMEKNVPENVLKNEVAKLLDEKNTYQHTAKEALRKVYQERCDALQKLYKAQMDLVRSEDECKIINDQLMRMEKVFTDTNIRLKRLEADYNEHRESAERQQIEAKVQAEQQIEEVTEKLDKSIAECQMLRKEISELRAKQAERIENEDQLQKQAIERLDASYGEMNLDDDDDDDDEDDEDANENVVGRFKTSKLNESSNGRDAEKQRTTSNEKKSKVTILKWLQNSDLNEKEGSSEIFKAICNESDSSDDLDVNSSGASTNNLLKLTSRRYDDFLQRCSTLTNILKDVENNLKILETQTPANDDNQEKKSISLEYQMNDADSGVIISKEEMIQSSEENKYERIVDPHKDSNEKLSNDKCYTLVRNTIHLLYEAHTGIRENVKCLQELANNNHKSQIQAQKPQLISNKNYKQVEGIISEGIAPLPEINEDDEEVDHDSDDDKTEGSTDSKFVRKLKSRRTLVPKEHQESLDSEVLQYKQQVAELKTKLESDENQSRHILDMLQTECDSYKERSNVLSKRNELLVEQMNELEAKLKNVENSAFLAKAGLNNSGLETKEVFASVTDASAKESLHANASVEETVSAQTTDTASNTSIQEASPSPSELNAAATAFDEQMHEELSILNNNAVQREEELIAYKESFEAMQSETFKLRDEIRQLELKANEPFRLISKQNALPIVGLALLAIVVYFFQTFY